MPTTIACVCLCCGRTNFFLTFDAILTSTKIDPNQKETERGRKKRLKMNAFHQRNSSSSLRKASLSSTAVIGKNSSNESTRSEAAAAGTVGTAGGRMSTISFSNPSNPDMSGTSSRAVWWTRIIFSVCLAGLAATLGTLAHKILTQSEQSKAEEQLQAMAERALDLIEERAHHRREGLMSMAKIAASSYPNASIGWPNVAIPAFETIAQDYIHANSVKDMGYLPRVWPSQLMEFETFAYEHYSSTQRVPPFPNGTGIEPTVGPGVWAENSGFDPPRYHDTTGKTTWWTSPNEVLFPLFQYHAGTFPFLMLNYHSIQNKGEPLDQMMACTDKRKANQDSKMDCGFATDINKWDRTTLLIEPIYPAMDLFEFTGAIYAAFSWDSVIEKVFEGTVVTGLSVVVESEGTVFSYHVMDGKVEMIGAGDLHETEYSNYGLTVTLSATEMSGSSSRRYDITIYPTTEFFDLTLTDNPMIASIGSVLIVFVTSLIFFLYDYFVRHELAAKNHLLQAKRKFMRFVSHEVRTPMNAVIMGLTLMEEELRMISSRGDDCLSQAPASRRPVVADSKTNINEPQVQLSMFDAGGDVIGELQGERPGARSSHNSQGKEHGHMELLERNIKGWSTLTKEIRNSALSAVDVLNDLLNYDKIEVGNLVLDISVVPIWRLIEETAREFKLSAIKKQIDFTVDFTSLGERGESLKDSMISKKLQHRCVVGDSVRLTQVLRNLLSNAVKFTPDGGGLKIRTSWLSPKVTDFDTQDSFTLNTGQIVAFKRSGAVQVEVVDSGAGMSRDQLANLFRDGIQFNANELQAGGGSGLGLFITKGIIDQHGGSLEANSEGLGYGTTFICTLPLYYVPEPACSDDTTSHHSLDGTNDEDQQHVLHILIVDDVEINRKLLARLATRRGHTVDQACHGQEAVAKVEAALAENKPFGSILMDYEMPVLNGPEAAAEIRKLGCDSFIVGITGNLLAEDVNYFKSSGANIVLPKPVDFDKLEEVWAANLVTRRKG